MIPLKISINEEVAENRDKVLMKRRIKFFQDLVSPHKTSINEEVVGGDKNSLELVISHKIPIHEKTAENQKVEK